jgi:hypothetical protein
MRTLAIAIVAATTTGAAIAHPHPGGIVVRADGTIVVGDILHPRLLVIEAPGAWREIRGVGNVRELEQAADGTLHGVSQSHGIGLWKLGPDERPAPVLPDFHGLFALGEDGALVLAAAHSLDRLPVAAAYTLPRVDGEAAEEWPAAATSRDHLRWRRKLARGGTATTLATVSERNRARARVR